MNHQNAFNQQSNASKPTHSLRMKTGPANSKSYETIGVAWEREDGGLYIKLHGTQIISNGFYAMPVNDTNMDQ